jgi:hypothetical protein
MVPSVSGMNIESLIERALGAKQDKRDPAVPILDRVQGNDRIQIYLE